VEKGNKLTERFEGNRGVYIRRRENRNLRAEINRNIIKYEGRKLFPNFVKGG